MMPPFISPLGQAEVQENVALQELVSFVGYPPQALFTMAPCEGLLSVVLDLVRVVLRADDRLTPALKFLIACQASRDAGSHYTTTHFVHSAHLAGVDIHKLAALAEFGSSHLFAEAEKSALRLASLPLPMVPPVERADAFKNASQFFDSNELAELVAAISTAKCFSAWNALVGTELEDEPASVISAVPWLHNMIPSVATQT